ncbi:hypothetical protein DOY81_006275, partial [Sarcophaga bullata]
NSLFKVTPSSVIKCLTLYFKYFIGATTTTAIRLTKEKREEN